jgi:hypothetical protein
MVTLAVAALVAVPGLARAKSWTAKKSGDLQAALFVEYLGTEPTGGGCAVPISCAGAGEAAAAFTALVTVTGCTADDTGRCDVTADFSVLGQQGMPCGAVENAKVSFQASEGGTGTKVIDAPWVRIPSTKGGAYQITAAVEDHISGTKLELRKRLKIPTFAVHPAQPRNPAAEVSLVGMWKDDCKNNFGLDIRSAGPDEYSISFCGPGGCFPPGAIPNSPIYGDPNYWLRDPDTLEVLTKEGYTRYKRCPQSDRRHADFVIKAGVMSPSIAGRNRFEETRTFPMDPARRPGWCFIVDPPTDQPYDVYSVHYLPTAPSRLTGELQEQDATRAASGVKTDVVRAHGFRSLCYDFDLGDPLGEYRVEIFIDGELKTTLRLEVVAPTPPAPAGTS